MKNAENLLGAIFEATDADVEAAATELAEYLEDILKMLPAAIKDLKNNNTSTVAGNCTRRMVRLNHNSAYKLLFK